MTAPEWFKPGIYGAFIGAASVGIVGFTWGGWVTGGTSQERAIAMSRDGLVAAMVPVCLDMAQTDPERGLKLAAIRDASRFQRRDALMEAGWATVPGTDSPNRDLAHACLASLDVEMLPEGSDPVADEG